MHKSTLHILIPAVVAALLVIATSSCNTSGCLENQNSLPLAGMYSMSTKAPISVQRLSVGGVGAPDSALLSSGSSVRQVYLPFRANTASTSFFFTISGNEGAEYSDTVTFSYESQPSFVSEECGAMFYYRIVDVTHTQLFIDSIGITDSLITNLDTERIAIYFHDDSREAGSKP